MSLSTDRAAREAQIWDNQELQRGGLDSVLAHANDGPARSRRDRFIKAAVADLGDKVVLEIGSQAWSSILNKNGVHPRRLVCINISQTEIESGRQQAEQMGFSAEFKVMDAHKLDFPDASFDFVYGTAILHHLDFDVALAEIARVTKPNGRILFVEPLRLNPAAQLVRLLTPKARTPDEKPLGLQELQIIERHFRSEHLFLEFFHLPAAVLSRFLFKTPINALTRAADALDAAMTKVLPALGPYCRSIVVHGAKL